MKDKLIMLMICLSLVISASACSNHGSSNGSTAMGVEIKITATSQESDEADQADATEEEETEDNETLVYDDNVTIGEPMTPQETIEIEIGED